MNVLIPAVHTDNEFMVRRDAGRSLWPSPARSSARRGAARASRSSVTPWRTVCCPESPAPSCWAARVLGAAVGAAVMIAGVNLVQRRSRLSGDTAIGQLVRRQCSPWAW